MSAKNPDLSVQAGKHHGPPRACYVHVPFCRHRCGYCSFTLLAGRDDLMDSYLEAIKREITLIEGTHEIDSLFLGGGTPTHMASAQFAELLQIIRSRFSLTEDCEFSVEANPTDLQPELVELIADHGVTRISLGAQSFNRDKLSLLERDHTAEDIANAFELLRGRFTSLSLDLIFAVPGESLTTWQNDLDQAVRIGPNHISTYGLTFEKGTSFWSRLNKRRLAEVDEELQREMYLAAIDKLNAAGIQQYEVSNFARVGHRCRHNEGYWKGEQFYGFGPGAARFIGGVRELNHRSTTTYIKRLLNNRSPVAEREQLDPIAAAREKLAFTMRTLDGVDREEFYQLSETRVEQLLGDTLPELVELGMIEDNGQRIKLTRKGLLLSDSVMSEFLS